MTNQEKYKQAFSAIHTSNPFYLEVKAMEKTRKQHRYRAMVAAVAAGVMLVGSATVAYATDLGGIQRTLQLWIHGDQTEVTLRFDGDGNYQMEYIDDQGEPVRQGGGGVAIAEDGTGTPLSEEELLAHLTAPSVRDEADGSVWVDWFDQTIEITDQFENGICYVQLVRGEEILYMTITAQNGYATSPLKYPSPPTFD